MNIIYSPNSSDSNKYIDLMKQAIKKIDKNINFYSVREGVKLNNFFKINYICLNWFESLDNSSNFKFFLSFLKKLLVLNFMFLFRKKIVFVFHNKIPHETKNKKISFIFIKILLMLSNNIIIHCKESSEILKRYINFDLIKSKIVYVPHPSYIGAYPELKVEERNGIDQIKFLFLGNIRPYKNIEMLIEIFNKLKEQDVLLEIAGNVSDKNYEDELLNKIKSEKIKTDFRFIPDDEVIKKMKENDILILPYHLESSLNSGAVILAFSNKKTIISSNIPMLKDIKNNDAIYTYSYSNKEEEQKELLKQIMKVISDYKKDCKVLDVKGKLLYEEMFQLYSLKEVSKQLNKIYI